MFKKWSLQESFFKSIPFTIMYSFIALGISLILLVVNTSWLYGTLVGIVILWFSYFVIWVLWYKIPKIKSQMVRILPIGIILLRIIIFISSLLIISLVINPWLIPGLKHKDKLLEPINTISLLLTYSLPILSYLTIGTIDIIHSINLQKKGK